MIEAHVFMPAKLRYSVARVNGIPLRGSVSIRGMKTIGERVRKDREDQGITRADLARAAGIAQSTLSDLELGLSKSTTALHKIAARLGVNVHWLETGRGPKHPSADDSDWPDITGFAQAVGLGDGVEAEEYAQTHKLKFRASSLARKGLSRQHLAVVYGNGDSMLPRIHSGDAILFDTSDTRPRDEALFVIQTHGIAGGEYSVKRCRHFGDDVYFDALNLEGDHQWRKPRRMDDKRHPITVIGRVRWIGSWED